MRNELYPTTAERVLGKLRAHWRRQRYYYRGIGLIVLLFAGFSIDSLLESVGL